MARNMGSSSSIWYGREASYPTVLKAITLILIYKEEGSREMGNYRPYSLFCQSYTKNL